MLLQIDYIIYLTNIINKANIIYWSLIKYKQVIQSISAVKLYAIAYEFNIGAVIKTTLKKIHRLAVILILYINSKFLYNYLVKLGIR